MRHFVCIMMIAFLLTFATSLQAQQVAPQPFLAPPQLPQAKAATTLALPLPTGCKPDGNITRDGNLVTLHLVAKSAPNDINNPALPNGGKDKVALRSYGGCLTGPAIEAKPGDTLRIFLRNDLPANDPSCNQSPGCFNTINMHFHGLHVSPAGNSDNVLLNIAPQTDFEYEINIPQDHPSGTFWYHAHRHQSTAIQVASGESGALIVRGDRRYTGGAAGDIDTILHDASGQPMPEKILLLQQIPYACFDAAGKINENPDHTWRCDPTQTGIVQDFDQQLASPTVWETSGRFTSINGAVQPVLSVPAGQIQRWRFIHAGIHDTVNLQIVPMVDTGPNAALALRGILQGSAKQQVTQVEQLCPTIAGSKPVDLVPQFEIATDGLTRSAIVPIGMGQQSQSGSIGTNYLQPGYRSDILVVFPHAGTYCLLNQASTPAERTNSGVRGQGPNETQLLATVTVDGSASVTGDLGAYVRQALYDGNKNDPDLPKEALDGLLRGDLTPWRGMPEEGPASNSANPRAVSFYIGPLPDPGHPNDPKGPFGFYLNDKSYDPDTVNMMMQVNTTEDWVLASYGEPHIYHIHVNPFEIMDVTHNGKSIFGPDGKCLVPPSDLGLQNQYCNMWRTFKDTVFVQNDYQVHIRTTYDRYIGEYVLHCHILDHEDMGMMANVLIVPDKSSPNGGLGMAGMKTMSNGTTTQPMQMQ